jgi:hypothetical protein
VPRQLHRRAEAGRDRRAVPYKTRKKALGPFKAALWSIGPEAEAEIGANLGSRIELLFERLGVDGTRELVDRWVSPPALDRPMPAALGGAGAETIQAGADTFADDGSGE